MRLKQPKPIGVASWQLQAAWSVLLWETVLPAFWPVAAVVMAFLILALTDILPSLPLWGHVAVLLAFTGALALAAALGLGRLRVPERAGALRRIETASGLAHRPLSGLQDRPAGLADDAIGNSLWQAHRARLLAGLGRLRIGWPAPVLPAEDPYGLRAVLVLALFLGWIMAGGESWERLRRAVTPDASGLTAGVPVTADLWITPPAYTGLAPIYLKGPDASQGGDKPIAVPQGSALLAQVHGTSRTPKLTIDGVATGKVTAMDETDFSLTTKLASAQTIQLRAGGSTLLRAHISIVPDLPPTIRFTKPPVPTAHSALAVAYDAQDDYGVTAVRLEIRQALQSANGTDTSQGPDPDITVPLPVPAPPARQVAGTSFEDLTADPLAGQAVQIQVVAVDNIGQTTASDPVTIMLPERVFQNPVARAVALQRKLLLTGAEDPAVIGQNLHDLAKPETLDQDAVSFLGLTVASHQLLRNRSPASRTDVAALLWDVALRIEDGALADAQKSLRQAEQALQDALARNAPSPEIERLMQKLQQQVNRYLQSLAQQQGAHPPKQASGPSRSITPGDIQKMMDRAKDLARTGDAAGARQALAELQETLEALKASQGQGMSSADQQALRGMGDLQKRQQQLMDQTFQHSRQGNGQGGKGQNGNEAGTQEAIRKSLDQLMKSQSKGKGSGGDVLSDSLDRAERAMQDAETELKSGNPGGALNPQGDALDALQQAGREMARQMGQNGKGGGEGGSETGSEDPFGHGQTGHGMIDRGDVTLPTQSELRRSREILDELRRRDGDYTRPQEERDYIDRLLKNF